MLTGKDYVNKIRVDIEESSRTRLGKDSVNMLNTVSESIFSRIAHFILELLQNAEDAKPDSGSAEGEIEFAISPHRIKVTHNGAPFMEANVDAICGVRSTKKPESGTLGYLGIGFKSVFKITDRPEVHSGHFHFKFDKTAYETPETTPWQIMPIWIDAPSEPVDPKLTTFILPFRNDDFYQQTLAELKKLDVHVFMFLKWLRRLRVVDELGNQAVTIENLGVTDSILQLKKNNAHHKFVMFRRPALVPKHFANDPVIVFYKRQNVTQREVVIAFAVDDAGNLKTIEEASALGSVSSFLPLAEERSGAKFLIQADFLVQPGREAIQYELEWNRWLVKEAVELAKTAIESFKANPRWGRQFLQLFKFESHVGQPAFDRLFGPFLETPLLNHLQTGTVVATVSGNYVQPELIVSLEDGLQDLLTDADLPQLFPGEANLCLVDPTIEMKSLPNEVVQCFKRADLGLVARNKRLLESKVTREDNASWFAKLYLAMARTNHDFRKTQGRGKGGKIVWYDAPILVLTDRDDIISAMEAYLREIPQDVLELREKYQEVDSLLGTYKLINQSLDTEELNQFFKERTHVQPIDYDRVCRKVFFQKISVEASVPSKDELIAYTRLLQKGPSFRAPIWVVTQLGDFKPSNQVFMGTAYSPAEDWEKNAQYSPQIDFLNSEYLQGVPAEELSGWKDFFEKVGVKQSGETNHVEMFAMVFVEEKLKNELSGFIAKNRQHVGYDREARRRTDDVLVKIEIKGQKQEQPVRLVGKEPVAAKAAKSNSQPFWVCVVSGIPETPQLWVVEQPLDAGNYDTLTIDIAQWRNYGRRVP